MTCERCGKEVPFEDAFTILRGIAESVREWTMRALCERCADEVLEKEVKQ